MWIHEHSTWPHFTWNEAELSTQLAKIRHEQGLLLGRMENLGFPLRQEASLLMLTSDILKSSAIEGESLSRHEVRSSLARRLGIEVAGLVPVSRAVDGLVEMMLDATQNFAKPLTEKRLFAWHRALFPSGFSGMHPIVTGHWRTDGHGPMQVVSGPIGKEKVHFEAPAADRLEEEMRFFLHWFNEESELDPLIKAGIAHLFFVTIHPFEDGNGRIARAIGDMALALADATPFRFYSLSAQIERERKDYYLQLERQQRAEPDITSWLSWFLSCLGRAFEAAKKSLDGVLFKARFWKGLQAFSLNARQQKILARMLEDDFEGAMHTAKYAKMAKCSKDTALRDIQELKSLGIFLQNPGGGRSTSYRLGEMEGE